MFWSELNWSTTPNELPPNIRFDLAVFEHNRRVRDLEFAVDKDAYYVRFNFRVRGSSAAKVTLKASEPIAIKYSHNATCPMVHALREDFPRDVPHINETPDDQPCHLCLWAHGTTEALYSHHGMAGILRQLESWLSDTERGKSQKDGWDPTPRFDTRIPAFIVCDIGALQTQIRRKTLRSTLNAQGKSATYSSDSKEPETICGFFAVNSADPFAERDHLIGRDLFSKPPKGNTREDGTHSCSLDVRIMCAKKDDALETHQTISLDSEENLQQFANEIGLGEMWRYQVASWKKHPNPFHCIVLIGQWRKQRLNMNVPGIAEGDAGCIEITPVLIRYDGEDGLTFCTLKFLAAPSSTLLAGTSGTKPYNTSVALIGCGALGSVLADGLARSGVNIDTVIDDDFLMPHNMARHILTRAYVGHSKAGALSEHLNQLPNTRKSNAWHTNVLLCQIHELRSRLNSHNLIIDTSASLEVHRHLASLGLNTPVARCYMSGPAGSNGVLYIDAPSYSTHNDCHNHVIAQAAHESVVQQWAEDTQQDNLSSVSIGIGCNSVSLTLPLTTIQAHAAVMAVTLRKWLDAPAAMVMVNTQRDGISTGTFISPIKPPKVSTIPTTGQEWQVRIADDVLQGIIDARHPTEERCGYLLGGVDYYLRQIHLTAFSTSTLVPATPTRCALPPEDDDPETIRLRQLSHGMLYTVGSWHSHLGGATPSPIDISQMKKIQHDINVDNQPFVMLISGINSTFELRVSFPDNWGIQQITHQQEVIKC